MCGLLRKDSRAPRRRRIRSVPCGRLAAVGYLACTIAVGNGRPPSPLALDRGEDLPPTRERVNGALAHRLAAFENQRPDAHLASTGREQTAGPVPIRSAARVRRRAATNGTCIGCRQT